MQKLQPLQNDKFRAKIKIAESDSTTTLELFYAKKAGKN